MIDWETQLVHAGRDATATGDALTRCPASSVCFSSSLISTCIFSLDPSPSTIPPKYASADPNSPSSDLCLASMRPATMTPLGPYRATEAPLRTITGSTKFLGPRDDPSEKRIRTRIECAARRWTGSRSVRRRTLGNAAGLLKRRRSWGESATGTSPVAARRTGRDTLASSGSHQTNVFPSCQ